MKATAKNNEVISKIDEEIIANVEYVASYEVEDVTAGATRVAKKVADKKAFDTKEALTNRRDDVIAKYNELTKEAFFNQISLKGFMMQVLRIFYNNRIRSQKEFDGKFENLLGVIYVDNSSICSDTATDKDLKLKKMYKGTAMMSLI